MFESLNEVVDGVSRLPFNPDSQIIGELNDLSNERIKE